MKLIKDIGLGFLFAIIVCISPIVMFFCSVLDDVENGRWRSVYGNGFIRDNMGFVDIVMVM